jgi:16S rRNA (guanine527-N7)-methyltransferase
VKHEPAEDLVRSAARLGVRLDDDQAGKMLRYEKALASRAIAVGLIAEGDARILRERHTLDSLRAVPAVEGVGARDAYDLGSGAGLPGIVLAIACPEVRFGLVDSRRKRISFLESVIDDLAIANARAIGVRAETLSTPVDVCFARAFGPLSRAWDVAERVLRPNGRLVYFGGVSALPDASEGPGRATVATPRGARVLDVLRTPVLESAGPLVIMARQ